MLAIITMKLEKPTRFGRSVIEHRINARQGAIRTEINSFISERQRRENFIKVLAFNVKVLNTRKQVIDEWTYIPTYRNE